MYTNEISQFYRELLGRNPDPAGLSGFVSAAQGGTSLATIRSIIAGSPEAASYQAKRQEELAQQQQLQQQQQLAQLQSSFQQQVQQQAAQFAEQQRLQQLEMQRIQQQSLEAQTRQAAPEQTAQVATGVGSLKILRPGGSSLFSRPELQIKSMNI